MAGNQRGECAVLAAIVICSFVLSSNGAQSIWPHWGGDLNNRRFSDHSCIDFKIGKFTKLWTFTTNATVVATPAVCNGSIYVVDQSVRIYKLNTTGQLQWSVAAKDLLPSQANVGIRTTPILSADCSVMYLTTQWTNGAWLIALTTDNATVLYTSQIDPQPQARITSSGVLFNGTLYIGVASSTEWSITSGTTFRGNMVAMNATDGTVIWRTYTCPQTVDGLYTGCAIWGSSPAVDVRRYQVCAGTGNNYELPAKVYQCVKAAGTNLANQRKCSSPDNFVDSMVCFDMFNGSVRWARNMHGVDLDLPNSVYPRGLDYDYGQGPVVIHKGVPAQDIIIGTTKGGLPAAFNPINGATRWASKAITAKGFSMFGSCTNNKFYCVGYFWWGGSKQGVVACLDAMTGALKWRWNTMAGGVFGPLTCTQAYVFVPQFDAAGSLVVLDINKGTQVASFATGRTLFCGPAIVNGVAYVGSGYTSKAAGAAPSNMLHALQLPMRGVC